MPERLSEALLDLWTPLIILWITLPACVYTAPTTPSQVLASGSRLELNRLSEAQRILNRSKRGWVWNQMFVLEEFSGPEPILVGRVSFVFKIPKFTVGSLSLDLHVRRVTVADTLNCEYLLAGG